MGKKNSAQAHSSQAHSKTGSFALACAHSTCPAKSYPLLQTYRFT
ncbi:hypothetical protein HMPREF9248_0219 [Fannyhessea vaginae PB189-T1-4]|uniref:Uncharacterized protein n=1 Tax=Fannyhessea vaginae PB189-T1-4 TaxID=866774 RepID=A0ABN0AZI0_9ACTN|nr:hypothetical protein HMPREF9248_0219 [Fannyhessea vaginae PB189-T1-4]